MKLKEVLVKAGDSVKVFGKAVVRPMTKKRMIALAIVTLLGAFGVTVAPEQAEVIVTVILSLL